MSLELLGLACNIFQVLSFSHELISTWRRYYHDGTPDPGAETYVYHHSESLKRLEEKLDRGLPRPLTSDQAELLNIATKTHDTTSKLKQELEKVKSQPGSRVKAISYPLKRWWRKDWIDSLEKDVGRMTNTLQTSLLSRICNVSEANAAQQNALFQLLDADTRYFIQQLSQGYTDLTNLIRNRNQDLMNHSRDEHEQTRDTIVVTAALTQTEATEETIRKDFLQSLWFETINKRMNDITEPVYPKTYSWLFDGSDEDSAETHGDETENSDLSNVPIDHPWLDKYTRGLWGRPWDSFHDWLGSSEPVYWISGKPGCGKSTLMRYLETRVSSNDTSTNKILRESTAQGQDIYILSYFFVISGDLLQKSVKGLLLTLLYQICDAREETLSHLVKQRGLRKKRSPHDWAETELQKLLLQVLQDPSFSVCIFVDGLDEVSPDDGPYKLLKLLRVISKDCRAKICLSSRPEDPFSQHLVTAPCLQLHRLISGDIYRFAYFCLKDLLKGKTIPAGFKQSSILERIAVQSEGVFLWAVLAVKSLEMGIERNDSPDILEKRLKALPSDLKALYSNMWERLNDDIDIYKEEAAFCFNLVLDHTSEHSRFNLRCTWLMIFLAYENYDPESLLINKSILEPAVLYQELVDFQRKVAIRCAGLLQTRDATLSEDHSIRGYVTSECRFVHRTAREFFISQKDAQAILKADKTTPGERKLRLFTATLSERILALNHDFSKEMETLTILQSFTWYYSILSNLGAHKVTQFPLIMRYLHHQEVLATDSELKGLCNLKLDRMASTDTYEVFSSSSRFNMKEYFSLLLRASCSPEDAFSSLRREPRGIPTQYYGLVSGLIEHGANPNQCLPSSQSYCIYTPFTMFLITMSKSSHPDDVFPKDAFLDLFKYFVNNKADLAATSWGIIGYEDLVFMHKMAYSGPGLSFEHLRTPTPKIYIKFNGWALLDLAGEKEPGYLEAKQHLATLNIPQGSPIFEVIMLRYLPSKHADAVSRGFSNEQALKFGGELREMIHNAYYGKYIKHYLPGIRDASDEYENDHIHPPKELLFFRRIAREASELVEDTDQYLINRGLTPLGGNHTLSRDVHSSFMYSAKFTFIRLEGAD